MYRPGSRHICEILWTNYPCPWSLGAWDPACLGTTLGEMNWVAKFGWTYLGKHSVCCNYEPPLTQHLTRHHQCTKYPQLRKDGCCYHYFYWSFYFSCLNLYISARQIFIAIPTSIRWMPHVLLESLCLSCLSLCLGQDNEQEVRKEAVRVIEACLNLLGISAPWTGRNRGDGSDRVG